MNFLSDTDNSSCQSLLDLVSELDADPFNAAQEDIPWTQYVYDLCQQGVDQSDDVDDYFWEDILKDTDVLPSRSVSGQSSRCYGSPSAASHSRHSSPPGLPGSLLMGSPESVGRLREDCAFQITGTPSSSSPSSSFVSTLSTEDQSQAGTSSNRQRRTRGTTSRLTIKAHQSSMGPYARSRLPQTGDSQPTSARLLNSRWVGHFPETVGSTSHSLLSADHCSAYPSPLAGYHHRCKKPTVKHTRTPAAMDMQYSLLLSDTTTPEELCSRSPSLSSANSRSSSSASWPTSRTAAHYENHRLLRSSVIPQTFNPSQAPQFIPRDLSPRSSRTPNLHNIPVTSRELSGSSPSAPYRRRFQSWKPVKSELQPTKVEAAPLEQQCHLCLRKFSRNSDLKRHLKSTHSKERVPCDFCDQNFSRRDALTRHIKTLHSEHVNDDIKQISPRKAKVHST